MLLCLWSHYHKYCSCIVVVDSNLSCYYFDDCVCLYLCQRHYIFVIIILYATKFYIKMLSFLVQNSTFCYFLICVLLCSTLCFVRKYTLLFFSTKLNERVPNMWWLHCLCLSKSWDGIARFSMHLNSFRNILS